MSGAEHGAQTIMLRSQRPPARGGRPVRRLLPGVIREKALTQPGSEWILNPPMSS